MGYNAHKAIYSTVSAVLYSITTIRLNVLAAFSPPSQGRLYSIDIMLSPSLSVLKVHTSLPAAPIGAPASGASYLLSTFSKTVWSVIPANSHWKPVVAFDSRVIVNEPPTGTLISLPLYEASTTTSEEQADRPSKIAIAAHIRINFDFMLQPSLF